MAQANVHGTALLVGSRGILIRGPSQSGKSSLCLSLLRRAPCQNVTAALVADDRVDLHIEEEIIVMSAPPALSGMMEIYGIGIVKESCVPRANLSLVVDLVPRQVIVRMPEPSERMTEILGRQVRRIVLAQREPAFGADVVMSLLEHEDLFVS
ncbi:hypothetical protein DYI37_01940 [Fulvimarina endophytica]|uniref:HPr kinase/phosphorylase C-terminal domain-containing protein n=1 Tax=Fulvimarina endophytica TaxID=2293836 RepID=A0A371XB28_9HYPH|nr:HPr kinase/phosphatase C-terminal domain-containing protein [Fulvimarina endophytica]RFC66244.1 hypothetical protein DYI37_01940 [Fulvimarina endophytica]